MLRTCWSKMINSESYSRDKSELTENCVSVDVQNVLERGGDGMIKLIGYCIYTQFLDPVFLLLVKNYQMQPTAAKATALFEQFVSIQAPLAISLPLLDRENDLQVMDAITRISQAEQPPEKYLEDGDEEIQLPVPYLPSKFVFDGLLKSVLLKSTQFTVIESDFDPTLTVLKNLPGGKLTPGQRHFNEHVWKPSRHRLSVAGFFAIANIGG